MFSAVGELGKSAELVARHASDEGRDCVAGERPVGPHLTDRLMAPLAGGRFLTGELTEHSKTNIGVLRAFERRVECGEDGIVQVFN